VIGDYVWVDANADGLQSTDPLERPLEGVVVSLFASNGVTLLDTTLTDATGITIYVVVYDCCLYILVLR
jgi:hypothetical protein